MKNQRLVIALLILSACSLLETTVSAAAFGDNLAPAQAFKAAKRRASQQLSTSTDSPTASDDSWSTQASSGSSGASAAWASSPSSAATDAPFPSTLGTPPPGWRDDSTPARRPRGWEAVRAQEAARTQIPNPSAASSANSTSRPVVVLKPFSVTENLKDSQEAISNLLTGLTKATTDREREEYSKFLLANLQVAFQLNVLTTAELEGKILDIVNILMTEGKELPLVADMCIQFVKDIKVPIDSSLIDGLPFEIAQKIITDRSSGDLHISEAQLKTLINREAITAALEKRAKAFPELSQELQKLDTKIQAMLPTKIEKGKPAVVKSAFNSFSEAEQKRLTSNYDHYIEQTSKQIGISNGFDAVKALAITKTLAQEFETLKILKDIKFDEALSTLAEAFANLTHGTPRTLPSAQERKDAEDRPTPGSATTSTTLELREAQASAASDASDDLAARLAALGGPRDSKSTTSKPPIAPPSTDLLAPLPEPVRAAPAAQESTVDAIVSGFASMAGDFWSAVTGRTPAQNQESRSIPALVQRLDSQDADLINTLQQRSTPRTQSRPAPASPEVRANSPKELSERVAEFLSRVSPTTQAETAQGRPKSSATAPISSSATAPISTDDDAADAAEIDELIAAVDKARAPAPGTSISATPPPVSPLGAAEGASTPTNLNAAFDAATQNALTPRTPLPAGDEALSQLATLKTKKDAILRARNGLETYFIYLMNLRFNTLSNHHISGDIDQELRSLTSYKGLTEINLRIQLQDRYFSLKDIIAIARTREQLLGIIKDIKTLKRDYDTHYGTGGFFGKAAETRPIDAEEKATNRLIESAEASIGILNPNQALTATTRRPSITNLWGLW